MRSFLSWMFWAHFSTTVFSVISFVSTHRTISVQRAIETLLRHAVWYQCVHICVSSHVPVLVLCRWTDSSMFEWRNLCFLSGDPSWFLASGSTTDQLMPEIEPTCYFFRKLNFKTDFELFQTLGPPVAIRCSVDVVVAILLMCTDTICAPRGKIDAESCLLTEDAGCFLVKLHLPQRCHELWGGRWGDATYAND